MSRIYSSHLAFSTSLLGLLTVGTVSVQAASLDSRFNQIFVFSDSLSDPGNISNLTGGAVPENPLSFDGRFSNGPVWIEYLSPKLGLNPSAFTSPVQSSDGINYSLGGATSGSFNIINILRPDIPVVFPGLTQELNYFIAPLLAQNQSANSDALYVVFAGANDYLFGGVSDPTIPVNNVSQAVHSLYDVGARNFLLLNLPGLGNTPLVLNSDFQDPLNQLTVAHNFYLSSAVNGLNQSLTGVNIGLVDINATVNSILQNPGEFGLTNVTDSWSNAVAVCLEVGCEEFPNPDEYFYWDAVHPTTAAHEILADVAYSTVQSQFAKVPEPTSTLALSALAVGFLFNQVSSHRRKN
ncbi:SGNH/GDSL hydrolase family protein [Lyngbya sp. PCC 8106]|uniref:SGNH/GDSL hydrolase family protein n=1 Tax=Lyngbya sp. (strain PCC 8106) TaxID=313612 RepID=UPI0000EADB17|nr:SGNH/GDSL hydrolase family protein [Lyngbya sp. PCC 8106]EAW36417.1 Lipolytic enzyme, G-D-S-L [Lyngbya sp. PCC 8106]